MIPEWTQDGFLPPGVYLATLEEVEQRFVYFDRSNRRLQLFARFKELVQEARNSNIVQQLYLAGSFVTSKPEPNDFDCIIVFDPAIVGQTLAPYQYNLMSRRMTRRKYDSDIMPCVAGSTAMHRYFDFFQTSREGKAVGIVEIVL
jgi:hypothetical protein